MAHIEESEPEFSMIGGDLSLDFANTVSDRMLAEIDDKLVGYPDLVSWSVSAEIVSDSEAEDLLEAARQRPEEASAVMRKARKLREAIYALFSAVAAGQKPEPSALRTLNGALTAAMCKS